MDIVIASFFFLVGATLSFIGYSFRSSNIGGLGGIALLTTGLMLLTGGLDSQAYLQQTQNFTALDAYLYNWNTTFNSSTIANVSTTFNKTITQTYYYNNTADNNTRTLSLLIMFAGLGVMIDAFIRKPEES